MRRLSDRSFHTRGTVTEKRLYIRLRHVDTLTPDEMALFALYGGRSALRQLWC